jgi:hypothetical protein
MVKANHDQGHATRAVDSGPYIALKMRKLAPP